MSYHDYKKAMELAKNCKFYTTLDGKRQDEIDAAERNLNIKFSKEIKDFYLEYGYLSFEGNEIFGIDPLDDSGILEGNSVTYALNEREQYGMPNEWLPFYNYGDGYIVCQNYSTNNEEGEPEIISVLKKNYQMIGIIKNTMVVFI